MLLLVAACRRQASESVRSRPLRVAAASDAEPAFVEIGKQFTNGTGRAVVWSFASSGALMQQIQHGAPFDLYASANAELVARLAATGRLVPGSQRVYARGVLAAWVQEKSADAPTELKNLKDLEAPRFRRIALANPEHAPYGMAAVAALRSVGIYEAVQRRLVFSENVRQALQFAETGNVEVTLTALPLLRGRGAPVFVVPQALHPPLLQTLAVVQGGDTAGAAALAAFICGPEGQAILGRYGFLPPHGGSNGATAAPDSGP